MAAKFYTWAWRQDVRGPRQHILLYLVEKADQSAQCWPSVHTISVATGCSQRSVKQHLVGLEQDGLIRRRRRYRSGGRVGERTSDLITLVVESDAGDAPTSAASGVSKPRSVDPPAG